MDMHAGRAKIADSAPPDAVSGQSPRSYAVRHPELHGIADLRGLVIGVQEALPAKPVADSLSANQRAARCGLCLDRIEKASYI